MLLAEIGPDMSRFPTDAHLASWAGMCPGQRESGVRTTALADSVRAHPAICQPRCQGSDTGG